MQVSFWVDLEDRKTLNPLGLHWLPEADKNRR
jgi:hypothetical protein